MKTLNLLLLFFVLGCGGASAQVITSQSAKSAVTVLKQNWRMTVRNPALDEDPMRINQDQMELQRAQQATQRENAARVSRGQAPLPMPRGTPSRRSMSREASTEYIYEAKFSNVGSRKISRVVWEYVFFLPGSQQEVGRRQFDSKVNIAPGKSASTRVRSVAPPASTVDVSQAGKKLRDQYSERIEIKTIEFADGTVWQRPTK